MRWDKTRAQSLGRIDVRKRLDDYAALAARHKSSGNVSGRRHPSRIPSQGLRDGQKLGKDGVFKMVSTKELRPRPLGSKPYRGYCSRRKTLVSSSSLLRNPEPVQQQCLAPPFIKCYLECYLTGTSSGSERLRSLSHSSVMLWLTFLGVCSSRSGMKISRPACAVMRV
jgi:hypothetical protein